MIKALCDRISVRLCLSSLCVGVLFSSFFSISRSFSSAGRFPDIDLSVVLVYLLFALLFAVLVGVCYLCLDCLRLNQQNASESVVGTQPFFGKAFPKKAFFAVWCVLVACWLPVLVIHFPGTLTFDNYYQMAQWDGISPVTTHHPPAVTLLFGCFWSLGDVLGSRNTGMFLYCLLQVFATAGVFSLMWHYARFLGLPKKIGYVVLVAFCVVPVFPLCAECMTKDYLHSIFFLLWFIGFIEICRTKGSAIRNIPFSCVFGLAMMCMILTKKTGIYVVLLASIVMLVVFRKQAARAFLITVSTALVYIVAVEMIIFPACGVLPAASGEAWSLPLQQTARVVTLYPESVGESQQAAIGAVLPYSRIPNLYDPELSDPIKFAFSAIDPTLQQKTAYMVVWAQMFLEHPGVYLEATLANTYEVFSLGATLNQFTDIPSIWQDPGDEAEVLLSEVCYTATPLSTVQHELQSLYSPQGLELQRDRYAQFVTKLEGSAFVPFVSKGLYTSWIPLLVVGYIIYRREYRALLALVPIYLNVLVIIASPVTQARYFTPLLYGALLVVAIAFGAFASGKAETNSSI